MKYRIIAKGKRFRAQYKRNFFTCWADVGYFFPDSECLDTAMRKIDEHKGKWQIVYTEVGK